MRLRSSFLIAVLTLWFALLQSMAPLLHAHLNGDSALDDGPHLHMAELTLSQEDASESDHAFHWHIHTNKSPGMILGLTPALTEQGWQLPDSPPLWLICLSLPSLLVAMLCLTSTLLLRRGAWLSPPFRRHTVFLTPASPRAPPQF